MSKMLYHEQIAVCHVALFFHLLSIFNPPLFLFFFFRKPPLFHSFNQMEPKLYNNILSNSIMFSSLKYGFFFFGKYVDILAHS